MYDIFTFGAEYIDRKEEKRYLNNIDNYELYVLITTTVLEDGKQMFSKSNLHNSIALPKVKISKSYKFKLGEETVCTEHFAGGDERLGITLSETNIDKIVLTDDGIKELNKTVFIPYEVYFAEEYPEYNPEATFNIRDYKGKNLIIVPRIDDYDNWRIFKAGERHKFFVAYFNFESLSDEEYAYYWIIAKNKDYDIVKNDIFYLDSGEVRQQDYNTALGFFGTQIDIGGDWNTLANKPQPPQAPVITQVNEFQDKMLLTFTFNTTIPIDRFEIYNKIGADGDWGLIDYFKNEIIVDENNDGSCIITDETYFAESSSIFYKVVAFNSIEKTESLEFEKVISNQAIISNLIVAPDIHGFTLNWDISNKRLLKKVTIKVDIKENSGSLNENDAILVYEGLNTSYVYTILDSSKKDYAFKFWVEAFSTEE